MTAMQSVATALEGVATWRKEQEATREAELVEVDSQLETLRAELAALQEKVASLEAFRTELQGKDPEGGMVARSYNAIFAALLSQATTLDERSAESLAARQARDAQVLATLPKSEIAPLVEEYEQFKAQEETLMALPESYRGAIVEHHQGVVERIQAYLDEHTSAPVPLEDAAPLELELVYAVDAPAGKPEVLICVLPVKDVVLTDWANRPEDVSTLLAARAVQSIYEALKQTGPSGAQAVYGGHQGLLALEVDIDGASKDVAKVLADNLGAVLKSAPELAAAKLSVTARNVNFDFLLPPLDEPGDDAPEAAEEG